MVVSVAIPTFDKDGDLPPGIHDADWTEFKSRYGTTGHRRALIRGLERALTSLAGAGCKRAYVDGSFVTSKRNPRDFDACWEEAGVDPTKLNPVLLNFNNQRAAQKAVFGGELFPVSAFLQFFQTTRGGKAKGIVSLDLTRWKP